MRDKDGDKADARKAEEGASPTFEDSGKAALRTRSALSARVLAELDGYTLPDSP